MATIYDKIVYTVPTTDRPLGSVSQLSPIALPIRRPVSIALGALSTIMLKIHAGFGIMCDNEDIYCDSLDYYCDGSVVMLGISYPTTVYYPAVSEAEVTFQDEDVTFGGEAVEW